MESFSGHEDESTGAGLLGPGRGAVRTSVFWRKLATGSEYHVQFTDPKKEYAFGVAVFDNAQVRHAYSPGVLKLKLA